MANVRRVKDFDALSKLIEERIRGVTQKISKLDGMRISVGIDPEAAYDNGQKVAKVARLIEYGTSRMPPRPFFRTAIASESPKWKRMIKKGIGIVSRGEGSNYHQLFEGVSKTIKTDVQKSIADYGAVRTGRLRDSVKAEVFK